MVVVGDKEQSVENGCLFVEQCSEWDEVKGLIPADKRKPEGMCGFVDKEIKYNRKKSNKRETERVKETERRTDSRRAVQTEPLLSTTSGSHQGAGRKKRWTQLKRSGPPIAAALASSTASRPACTFPQ